MWITITKLANYNRYRDIDVTQSDAYDERTPMVSVERYVKSELTGEGARTMTTVLQPRSYASNFRPAVRSFLSYSVVKLVVLGPTGVSRSAANYTAARNERRDDCYAVRTPWRRVVRIGKHVREQFGRNVYTRASIRYAWMYGLARACRKRHRIETLNRAVN